LASVYFGVFGTKPHHSSVQTRFGRIG
jgi:hypothetical protein